MKRRQLPNRRASETVKYEFAGFKWFATVGYFKEGDIGEVFLTSAKTGSLLLAMAKDSAIAASLALQYGVPIERLRMALTRDGNGEAGSPLAKALDLAVEKSGTT